MAGLDLIELAERVEKTSGPSAEERQCVIDAYNLIFPHELSLSEEEKGDDGTRYRRTLHRVEFTNYINTDYHRASLDAAMTLVPEGWILVELRQVGPQYWYAGIAPEEAEETRAEDFASTAALALTSSCLRARAAQTTPSKESSR